MAGKKTFTLGIDLAGLDRMIDQLGTDIQAAARPAAYAAGDVLHQAVKTNVDKIGRKTGNLARAIYIAFSKDNSGPGRATYHIGWNRNKAPHGHLVERGHIQRYVAYIDKNGDWKTAIRPEARAKGLKKPGRKASQAAKDAYYVTLPAPRHVAAQPFVRPAAALFGQASAAAEAVLLKEIGAL